MVRDNTDTLCFFLLQKDLHIFHERIGTFCVCFFQKDFSNFRDPFFSFESFLYYFRFLVLCDYIQLTFM